MRERLAGLTTAGVLLGSAVAGCGGQPEDTGGRAAESTTSTTAASTPDGLVGSVVAVDDTGLPDTPSGGGWIAVVPADRLSDVLALAGGTCP